VRIVAFFASETAILQHFRSPAPGKCLLIGKARSRNIFWIACATIFKMTASVHNLTH